MIWILPIAIPVLLIFALDQLVERMYRNEKKSSQVTPQKYDIPFEEILIPAKDGGQLRAWWIPSARNAPTLILTVGVATARA